MGRSLEKSRRSAPERVEEYLVALEDVRILPFGTGSVDIIYEKARAYFDGSRTVDEVIGIMQNKLPLYLDRRDQAEMEAGYL